MENCSYCNNRNKCGCGVDLVIIPANLGDDTGTYAPENGKYQDTVVKYEANGMVYLYAHDGSYVAITERSDNG